jgi:hypothetical protein
MICHVAGTLFCGPLKGGDWGWACETSRNPAVFKCMGWWGWGQPRSGIGDRGLQNCPPLICQWAESGLRQFTGPVCASQSPRPSGDAIITAHATTNNATFRNPRKPALYRSRR